MLAIVDFSEARHLPHTGGEIVAEAFIATDYNVENGQRIGGGRIKPPTGLRLRIAPNLDHFDAAGLSFG